jgi:hypothetical protein
MLTQEAVLEALSVLWGELEITNEALDTETEWDKIFKLQGLRRRLLNDIHDLETVFDALENPSFTVFEIEA